MRYWHWFWKEWHFYWIQHSVPVKRKNYNKFHYHLDKLRKYLEVD